MPNSPLQQKRAVDVTGAALLGSMTIALLLLLAWGGVQFPWLSWQSAALLILSLALLLTFLWREQQVPEPIIRLSLFRNPIYSLGVLVGGLMTFSMMGAAAFLPLYFQMVLGQTPSQSGFMMLPQVVGMVLTSIVGGRIVARRGRNKAFMIIGVGLEALALVSLAVFAWSGASMVAFLCSMACLGLGIGMGMPNVTTAVQNALSHRQMGEGTGAMMFVRSLGAAIGVAVSGAIMAGHLNAALSHLGTAINARDLIEHAAQALQTIPAEQQAEIIDAYRLALTGSFAVSALMMVLSLILVFRLPETQLRNDL